MCCGDNQPKNQPKAGIKTKSNTPGQKKDIKVVMLGDKAVGKSSIASRFCFDKFQSEYEITIGGVYNSVEMNVKGQNLKIHLWDTAGEEKFRSLLSLYYRDANAAIIVYDITQSESFQSVSTWLKELEEKIQKDGMALALVGNKCDCLESERKVPKAKATDFAKQNNMIFYETSAKTGEGVKNLFQQLIETYVSENM
ncbi:unnamed protein product [Paramecium primaurelia]|uniref:Uncharacterized protein n=2 Tax=Paramecium TaxID=5884 RepID=A0A8S1W9L4_9CILI|nr:unnamed protein product [Paramecium primaurelia]CAD8186918.1 unnamed protein product [Paramecium pentaurelia]